MGLIASAHLVASILDVPLNGSVRDSKFGSHLFG
jgi:hypothetical protein